MQIFHRSTNTVAKVSIFGSIFFLGFFGWVYSALLRSSYVTGQNVIKEQPVPFNHEHHVAQLGIDCRYCHTSVERSGFAGMPPTSTCINCHKQIWNQAELLAPVRESFASDTPVRWTRVHDLPDFVYFEHNIHVAKGIGCATCHGRVDRMPLMFQQASLQMEWCLDCHRDPSRFIRPREEVFNMAWEPEPGFDGRELVRAYNVLSPAALTSCSTCHR